MASYSIWNRSHLHYPPIAKFWPRRFDVRPENVKFSPRYYISIQKKIVPGSLYRSKTWRVLWEEDRQKPLTNRRLDPAPPLEQLEAQHEFLAWFKLVRSTLHYFKGQSYFSHVEFITCNSKFSSIIFFLSKVMSDPWRIYLNHCGLDSIRKRYKMDLSKKRQTFTPERQASLSVGENKAPGRYLPRPSLQPKRYSSPPGTLRLTEEVDQRNQTLNR